MTQLTEPIHIGISACQYGCKCRYNAKGWDYAGMLNRDKSEFIWHPVCPEVMAGLGVPRNPIRLAGGNGDDFWAGNADVKSRNNSRLTQELKRGANACLDTIKSAGVKVFIYMEGSPSCGVYRTTLKNRRLGKPPGIFGSLLLKEQIFLIPSIDLQSPVKWWDWRRRLVAFLWMDQQAFDNPSEIYDAWHKVKFICQEVNRKEADSIGRELADASNEALIEKSQDLKTEIMNILRQPSDIRKIKQSLWKHYSWLRKKHNIDIDGIKEPTDTRSMVKLAKELTDATIAANEAGLTFAASPVNYRKGR